MGVSRRSTSHDRSAWPYHLPQWLRHRRAMIAQLLRFFPPPDSDRLVQSWGWHWRTFVGYGIIALGGMFAGTIFGLLYSLGSRGP